MLERPRVSFAIVLIKSQRIFKKFNIIKVTHGRDTRIAMSKMYKVTYERARSFRKPKLASARCILHRLADAKISEVTSALYALKNATKKFIVTDEENRFVGRSFGNRTATILASHSVH